jgi:type I restriction enzyme S subunit
MMIVRSECNSYLNWFFKSKEFRRQINRGENTMINQITRYMLDDVLVSLPPRKEQTAIVERTDALSNETERLAKIYRRKLVALEALKKSLLHQAFTGQL